MVSRISNNDGVNKKMEQEKMQTLKMIMISSVVLVIIGYIGSIFLSKQYPLLGKSIKYIFMLIGGVGFAGGIIWMIAGDNLFKKKQPEKSYEDQVKEHELRLKLMKMETEVKLEEARQKEILNKLKLQDAKIQAMSQSTNPKHDVLGAMSDFIKPQNQQPQNNDIINNLNNMMNQEIEPLPQPRQRRIMPHRKPQPYYRDHEIARQMQTAPQPRVQQTARQFVKRPVIDQRTRQVDDFSNLSEFAIKRPENNKKRKVNDDGFF